MQLGHQKSNVTDGLSAPMCRVAFVTLGQSPRIDLVPEILAELDMEVETLEFGLLDDVHAWSPQEIAPGPEDPSFLTVLRDGTQIELSIDWAYTRFRQVYDDIISNGADLVVLMSASGGYNFKPQSATLLSDRVVDRAIEVFLLAEFQVGIVVPLDGTLLDLSAIGGPWPRAQVAAAKPGDKSGLEAAVASLTDCDIIVLHSMGYSRDDLELVRKLSKKPAILNRRLIANAIKNALQRLRNPPGNADVPALYRRLRALTDREREIMFLVATGQSNKEIGRELGISFRTVEIHRARMMEKMDFASLSDLVRVVDMVSDF
ncbi:MAG: AroM family protein [Hyphomicrobiaceae bacterium]